MVQKWHESNMEFVNINSFQDCEVHFFTSRPGRWVRSGCTSVTPFTNKNFIFLSTLLLFFFSEKGCIKFKTWLKNNQTKQCIQNEISKIEHMIFLTSLQKKKTKEDKKAMIIYKADSWAVNHSQTTPPLFIHWLKPKFKNKT